MAWYRALSGTARLMVRWLGLLFLLLEALGLLVTLLVYPFEAPLPYTVGLFLGCLTCVFKVMMLDKTLRRSADMEEKAARNYGGLMALLRYGFTILIMLCAVFFRDIVGVFGVVAGILSLQICVYITSAVLRRRPELIDDGPEEEGL